MEEVIDYKIVNREVKYSGKFKIEEVTIQKGDEEFKTEVFDRGNSVGALVYNTETKKYLFTSQYRVGAEGVMIEIVAGKIDEGETPQEAVKREIVEEVGYKVDTILHITDMYLSPGGSKEVMALFYVEVSEKIGDGGGIKGENITVVEVDELGMSGNLFFNISEDGMINPPYKLIDAKSIIAVNAHVQSKMLRELWKTMSDYKMKSL
jgi:nudix-type nucleoside diphosphatase (YffH/AdpP family)